jgi:hypothetical protein
MAKCGYSTEIGINSQALGINLIEKRLNPITSGAMLAMSECIA